MNGFDNRKGFNPPRLHLRLSLGGKTIAVAYIRKNACSALKKAAGYPPDVNVSRLLGRFWLPPMPADATVFIYRDPVERLASLYRNKVIQKRGADDITRRYRGAMGEAPSTFSKFVDFAALKKDPHCRPQSEHLLPIRYSHAIEMSDLHSTLSDLVGEDARVFSRRTNDSGNDPVDISSNDRRKIEAIYASDFAMIKRLS